MPSAIACLMLDAHQLVMPGAAAIDVMGTVWAIDRRWYIVTCRLPALYHVPITPWSA